MYSWIQTWEKVPERQRHLGVTKSLKNFTEWRNFRHTYISLSQVFLLWPLQIMHEVLKTKHLLAHIILSWLLELLRTLFSCGKMALSFPSSWCQSLYEWDSLCCLCQRSSILKRRIFLCVFSILLDHWQNSLEATESCKTRTTTKGKVLSTVQFDERHLLKDILEINF